jgi:hypothetical protein
MAEYKFYLKQPTASELVDKLLSVVEEVSPSCIINHFTLGTNTGQFNYIAAGSTSKLSAFKNRKDSGGILAFLNERPYLDVTSLSLNTNNEFNFAVRTDKGFYIALNTSGSRDSNAQTIAPISDALHKHFNLFRQQEVFENLLPDAEKQAMQTARTMLLDFASQAAHLSQLSASNTERMNEIIIKKTEGLDARYEQKNTDLDEAHRNRTKELNDEKEAFRKDKTQFDARENTVVRRDLLGKIQAIVENQKKIEITSDTIKKRTPIQTVCSIMIISALGLVGAFGYKIFTDTAPDWHHIVPFSRA